MQCRILWCVRAVVFPWTRTCISHMTTYEPMFSTGANLIQRFSFWCDGNKLQVPQENMFELRKRELTCNEREREKKKRHPAQDIPWDKRHMDRSYCRNSQQQTIFLYSFAWLQLRFDTLKNWKGRKIFSQWHDFSFKERVFLFAGLRW